MRKQPAAITNPARVVTVLSVSPLADDHARLAAVFTHSKWKLYHADSVASAVTVMGTREIGVVICERDLSGASSPPTTWVELLDELRLWRNPPSLIVTSPSADERLWAEAMNLGAYDVLSKPFARKELVRSVSLAWLRWHHGYEAAPWPGKVMQAAS